MKTTLNIPKELIDEAMKTSKKKKEAETIMTALKEYIRQRRLDEIIQAAGNLDFYDNWERPRHE